MTVTIPQDTPIPPRANRIGDIKPGDLFEDCRYHPCVCLSVDDGDGDGDGDGVRGVSLIDGSGIGCSVWHCGLRILAPAVADLWRKAGPVEVHRWHRECVHPKEGA